MSDNLEPKSTVSDNFEPKSTVSGNFEPSSTVSGNFEPKSTVSGNLEPKCTVIWESEKYVLKDRLLSDVIDQGPFDRGVGRHNGS